MKRRYFIYFSYKGTAYHGWQIQPNGISVQSVLTEAMSRILRTEIGLLGAGRTDAGVHAQLMVAHFDLETLLPGDFDLVAKLNSLLPKDIAVYKIVAVKPDAHARFDAISRRYEYHIVGRKNVFRQELATKVNGPLDFEAMNVAAQKLTAYRDFTSFSKVHTDALTNNCSVTLAEWQQVGEEWVFSIQADRFLRNMVRAIVGTLLEVGRGKMTVNEFVAVIESEDRCKAGVSVPAQGLYLVEINYPAGLFLIDNE